ncbi:tripartite tricarboxylate transporter substrate binding protein [Salsuginibacillus kocurii]|uniref:tripartite tricarboxylate transporter substrate binding protein n=1 Tax=Salsuginibacillus kocurii TaxID=427078 RepID=UPI0003781CB4|nr:tripartite tricarboxylate transporter substrate binding protein [Salsuginibacillus kocurii]
MKASFKPVQLVGALLLSTSMLLVACGEEEVDTGADDGGADDESEEENDVVAESNDEDEEESDTGDYPSETIEIVVPAGPGGDTDLNVRTLSEPLQEELGEDMVVTNVEGAGGTTGSSEILNAEPDGHQVLFFHNSMLINEILGLADYGYEDFKLAGIPILDEGNGFFVNADSPFDGIDDLVEHAQENPGDVDVATEFGAFTHLQLLALEDETGADFNIVDVGGASDKVAALQGEQIDVNPTQYGLVKEYIDSGDFKTLGILAEDTVPLMDDVPTFRDQGVDISFEKFFFFAFPPETPDDIVNTFTEALQTVVEENEEYQQDAEDFYVSPTYLDPDEAYDLLDESKEFYEELLADVDE